MSRVGNFQMREGVACVPRRLLSQGELSNPGPPAPAALGE